MRVKVASRVRRWVAVGSRPINITFKLRPAWGQPMPWHNYRPSTPGTLLLLPFIRRYSDRTTATQLNPNVSANCGPQTHLEWRRLQCSPSRGRDGQRGGADGEPQVTVGFSGSENAGLRSIHLSSAVEWK